MPDQTSTIISKVWGMCSPLRDDGIEQTCEYCFIAGQGHVAEYFEEKHLEDVD